MVHHLFKHGHSTNYRNSRTYEAWRSARARCRRPTHKHYANYGGRGITFSTAWDDFSVFLKDMGTCPDGLTLERKDNARGYEPGNCVWASRRAQILNRRFTVWLTHKGETLCATDWARRLNIDPHLIYGRLKRGWSVEKAVTTPAMKKYARRNLG